MKSIKLTQGYDTLVDDKDYEHLMQWNWYYNNGYAKRIIYENGKAKPIWLHRIINNTPEGKFTDHINRNTLDNRRLNLRICTKAQNVYNRKIRANNTSGFRGVSKIPNTNMWRARIKINGKEIQLGKFQNKIDAAKVYNDSAKNHFGSFAVLNAV